MFRYLLTILLAGLLVFAISQEKEKTFQSRLSHFRLGLDLVREAELLDEKIDADAGTYQVQDQFYKNALRQFSLAESNSNKGDSLDFESFLQSALVFHLLDSIPIAATYYNKAITAHNELNGLPDSLLFKPFLYLGGIQHSSHNYDSALINYKLAEKIQEKYSRTLEDAERMYNRLGVIHYEMGNYRQAGNYFEKAIAVLALSNPTNYELLVNYRMNIGSMLIKLGEFERAKIIFESLLQYQVYKNEILHNTGIIYQELGSHTNALNTFRKIAYGKSRRNIDLYYNLAKVFHQLNKPDSANHYLARAKVENEIWNGNKKTLNGGLINKFEGDILVKMGRLKEAIKCYQLALIQFDPLFNDTSHLRNPPSFTGCISFINLFKTLTSKAEALQLLYATEKTTEHLKSSLDAYTTAFNLMGYVQASYDSDESRLFLNSIKYEVHDRPINVAIRLFELTKEISYLEKAYFFDQITKASVLSLNVIANERKNKPGPFAAKVNEEKSLKTNLTRLSIRSLKITDSLQLKAIHEEIRDLEIRLGKIHNELKEDPAYWQLSFFNSTPPIKELQKQLDHNSVIVSYHLAPEKLLAFVITFSHFTHKVIPIDSNFYTGISRMKEQLSGFRDLAETRSYSSELYQYLIDPVSDLLPSSGRLIIIPDDELNYLPFEALKDEDNHYLLSKFSVQYQYTTSLVEKKSHYHEQKKTLGLAPFAGGKRSVTDEVMLPGSALEFRDITGKVLLNESATKENFIAYAQDFRYLHLATHAKANNDTPSRSYISFFPNGTDQRLYTEEITSLNLDSAELVILSACETGTGKLVKGEGLMSLSRAFAYAGCHDIITSLWKAEDRTTAFLMQRMHDYLGRGFTKDRSLQKAKLDLLNDKSIPPNLKTASNWAHMVFIGQYEPAESRRHSNLMQALIGLVLSFLIMMGIRIMKPAKYDSLKS